MLSLKRKLFIQALVGLVFLVALTVVNAHASTPQEPIDKQASVMYVMTFLIVMQRLFF